MGSPRWRRNQRLKCGCSGYWFPHRRGGGACEASPTRYMHVLSRGRTREEAAEAILEHVLKYGGIPSTECPF